MSREFLMRTNRASRNPRDRNAAPETAESARDSELVPKIVFSTKQRNAAKKLRVAALTSTPQHNLTRKIDNLTSETTKHPLQPTAARALTNYAECRAPRVMTRARGRRRSRKRKSFNIMDTRLWRMHTELATPLVKPELRRRGPDRMSDYVNSGSLAPVVVRIVRELRASAAPARPSRFPHSGPVPSRSARPPAVKV